MSRLARWRGFAARPGAPFPQASTLILPAEPRLAQRIGDRRDLELEVEVDRLSVGLLRIADRVGCLSRGQIGRADEIVDENATARVDALRSSLSVIAVIAVIALMALYFGGGIPREQPTGAPKPERA